MSELHADNSDSHSVYAQEQGASAYVSSNAMYLDLRQPDALAHRIEVYLRRPFGTIIRLESVPRFNRKPIQTDASQNAGRVADECNNHAVGQAG